MRPSISQLIDSVGTLLEKGELSHANSMALGYSIARLNGEIETETAIAYVNHQMAIHERFRERAQAKGSTT